MSLSSTSFFASFDITDKTQDLDISPVLLAALMMDTGVLGTIPMSSEGVYDTIHYWNEIALNSGQLTVDATGYDSTATTIGVTSTGQLRVGAILKNIQDGVSELVQVLSISNSTQFTCTRGFGGTTASDSTFDNDVTVDIIHMPLQEGSDIQADLTKAPSVNSNVTAIFERSITITRNQLKRRMAAIEDFLAQSLHDRTMELKRELEKAVIHSYQAASNPAGNDSTYRTFDGLLSQITNVDSTSEAMSYGVFNGMVKTLVDAGAADDQSNLVLVAPTKIRQTISGFDSSSRRLMESDTRQGYFIEQLVSDLGVVVDVRTSNYLGTGSPYTALLLDTSRIKLMPFADDTFKLMAATDWVDGVKRRILGEYTLEVRNADTAHLVHSGLTG